MRKKALGRVLITLARHQNVERVTRLIDRPPQVAPFAVDAQENLVDVPLIPKLRPAALEPSRVLTPELQTPAPDGLITQHDAPLEHQFLNVSERKAEAVVEPDAVADDLVREAVAFVEGATHGRPP